MKISKTAWCWAIPLVFSGVPAPETFQKTISSFSSPVIPADTLAPLCINAIPDSGCVETVALTIHLETGCDGGTLQQVLLDINNDGQTEGLIDSAYITGQFPDYSVMGGFPLGSHRLEATYSDTCGNSGQLDFVFEIADCTAPQVFCKDSLYFNPTTFSDLNGDGIFDYSFYKLYPADLLDSMSTDCTPPIRYSIHNLEALNGGNEAPNPAKDSIIVNLCTSLQYTFRVYAWDSAYNPYAVQPDSTIGGPNYDYCETVVSFGSFLLDAFNICGPIIEYSYIAGVITTEDNDSIAGVNVALSGHLTANDTTNNLGVYGFQNLTTGYDYVVTPQLNDDPKKGVSTQDLILINRHILATQLINSPYKRIAADVNNSKTITISDIIELRKLILGIVPGFASNTSWRFVPKSYQFPIPNNPFYEPFPESATIEEANLGTNLVHFVGIKIGDVNDSVTP